MLNISSLGYLAIDDPVLYSWLSGLTGTFNALQQAVGVDVTPATGVGASEAISPPQPPSSLQVGANLGTFQVTVGTSPNATAGVQYFAEASTDPNFQNPAPTVFQMGNTTALALSLGSQTLYWRARASYPGSGYSNYTYYGTAANPTAVPGGQSSMPAWQDDSFSGPGTAFTLTYAPSGSWPIFVFLNGSKTNAYTLNETTLSMNTALSSSDKLDVTYAH